MKFRKKECNFLSVTMSLNSDGNSSHAVCWCNIKRLKLKFSLQVLEARNNLPVDPKPPLLVKIAPDLSEQDKVDIASVVLMPQVR